MLNGMEFQNMLLGLNLPCPPLQVKQSNLDLELESVISIIIIFKMWPPCGFTPFNMVTRGLFIVPAADQFSSVVAKTY